MRLLGAVLCLCVPVTSVLACSGGGGSASDTGLDGGAGTSSTSSSGGSSSSSGQTSTPFVPSPDLVQVGDTGIYLPAGSERVAGAPPATDPATAPVIKSLTSTKVDEHTIVIDFEIETLVTKTGGVETEGELFVYVDFGVSIGIYKTKPTLGTGTGGEPKYPSNWRYAKYPGNCSDEHLYLPGPTTYCTEECIAACDCITCACPAIDSSGCAQGYYVRECALECTKAERDGKLSRSPFGGNKDVFASYAYDEKGRMTPPDGYEGTPELENETKSVGFERGRYSDIGCDVMCSAAPPPFGGGTPPTPPDAGPPTISRRAKGPTLTFKAPSFSTDVIFDSIAQQGPTADAPIATSARAGQAKLGPICAPTQVMRCK